MNPRCQYCGDDATDCANTCRDEDASDYMENHFDSYYHDRLSRKSLFRVIFDWFSIRYFALKEKHFPREISNDEIPF